MKHVDFERVYVLENILQGVEQSCSGVRDIQMITISNSIICIEVTN